MKPVLFVALLVLLGGPVVADARQVSSSTVDGQRLSRNWKRVSSGDVVAVGDASERELREAMGQIASFRAAFKQLYPRMRLSSPVPYRVVRFESPMALRRYAPRDERGRPQQFVGGYFSDSADLNLVALGSESTNTVFHEFTHSFMGRNFHSLPLWLEEGLAEFHATFDTDWKKGKSLIGRAPADRIRALRTYRFVPIKDVMFASAADMEKNWRDGERISMFYAESWALVHYLLIGRQQTAPGSFGSFVAAIERGVPVEQALGESFGITVDQLNREVLAYSKNRTFPALAFDTVDVDGGGVAVERMTEADVRYIQGDLLARVGDADEAEKELTRALELDPGHRAAKMSLAGVRLQQDRSAAAIELLEPMVAASPEDFSAAFHLAGALSSAGRHAEALALYTRCTSLLDASPHAWYGLSVSALALGRMAQANATLTAASLRLSSRSWYSQRAYAALGLGADAVAADDVRRYLDDAGWNAETVYTAFVGVLAHRRLNQPAQASELLGHAREAANVPEWTLAVIDYLDGRTSGEALLAKARENGEKTEAHAYVGFIAAAEGRRDEALMHFRWVRDQGARNYVEYGMVKAELRRLENRAPAAPTQ